MYQKRKGMLVISTTIALILSMLTGCNFMLPPTESHIKITKEELIFGAIETFDNAESLDAKIGIDIMEKSLQDGIEQSTDVAIEMEIKSHKQSETAYLSKTASIENFDDRTKTVEESYLIKENDEFLKYSYKEEYGEWVYESTDKIKEFDLSMNTVFDVVETEIDSFILEEDIINYEGKPCYVVYGVAKGLGHIFDNYNLSEFIKDITHPDIYVELNIYFDEETKNIYALVANFTDGIRHFYKEEGIDASVDNFIIYLTYNDFNNLEEIKVPEQIKTRAKLLHTEKNEDVDEDVSVITSEISDNWKDLDIEIDGIVYHFPYDFDKFEENGWYVDLEDYGIAGKVLNKGDRISSFINLENDNYKKKYSISFVQGGFKNYEKHTELLIDCDLWGIKIDTRYCSPEFKPDNCPKVEIAKGIKLGASQEEIVKAFGQGDDIYINNDENYIEMTYFIEDGLSDDLKFLREYRYMKLTIFEEYGLTAIELSNAA